MSERRAHLLWVLGRHAYVSSGNGNANGETLDPMRPTATTNDSTGMFCRLHNVEPARGRVLQPHRRADCRAAGTRGGSCALPLRSRSWRLELRKAHAIAHGIQKC